MSTLATKTLERLRSVTPMLHRNCFINNSRDHITGKEKEQYIIKPRESIFINPFKAQVVIYTIMLWINASRNAI